jgi:hypothetical protein
MSSEEMRVELEAFVNTGLREGWRGWPLKAEDRMSRTSVLPLCAGSARFWHRQDRKLIISDRSLEVLRVGRRCCMEN